MEEPQFMSAWRGRVSNGDKHPGGDTGLSPEPPRTRLLVQDIAQEEDDDAEGDEGHPPGQQEHDEHRDGGAEERGPLAVLVLPIALPEKAYGRVELVLAEALRGERRERHRAVPSTSLLTAWGRGQGQGPALTWKTLGAETRQANAENKVAPKIPAVMRGPNPDTMLVLCPRTRRSGPPVHHPAPQP